MLVACAAQAGADGPTPIPGKPRQGLSGAALAAIVACAIVVVAAVGLAVAWCVCFRRMRRFNTERQPLFADRVLPGQGPPAPPPAPAHVPMYKPEAVAEVAAAASAPPLPPSVSGGFAAVADHAVKTQDLYAAVPTPLSRSAACTVSDAPPPPAPASMVVRARPISATAVEMPSRPAVHGAHRNAMYPPP